MSTTLGYYPGCSGLGTSMEYDSSCRAVCKALGITFSDIPDWTCCGSTPAHTIDHALAGALAARNLAQVESIGLKDVITPCPSCLKNLRDAAQAMDDPVMKKRIDTLTARPLKEKHTARSVLQLLHEDIGLDAIRAKVVSPLSGLKVVTYYGCLLTRPSKNACFDNPENPTSMDSILEALGAEVLPFPLKVECCGASFAIPDKSVVPVLGGKLLKMAVSLGADAVVVGCPLCQMNLDLRQEQINRHNKTKYHIAVPYFSQLMGYAMGLDEKEIGFGKLIIDIRPALERAKQESILVGETLAAGGRA